MNPNNVTYFQIKSFVQRKSLFGQPNSPFKQHISILVNYMYNMVIGVCVACKILPNVCNRGMPMI
jgi:hypothetical protein